LCASAVYIVGVILFVMKLYDSYVFQSKFKVFII
jgi:hypothetical protein